jgi:hypothetical protein
MAEILSGFTIDNYLPVHVVVEVYEHRHGIGQFRCFRKAATGKQGQH